MIAGRQKERTYRTVRTRRYPKLGLETSNSRRPTLLISAARIGVQSTKDIP